MENERNSEALPISFVLLVLILIPLAFYWRHDLFFLFDDWTELDFISKYSFKHYLVMPDGEIYFPIFHLVYYILIKVTGENHGLLVLVNCIGTGLVAFLIYLFLLRHYNNNIALIFSMLYASSSVQPAIVWNAFYLCYILCLIFFLIALLLTDSYVRSSSNLTLWGIGLFSCLSIHSHNYAILALLVLPLYVLFMGGRQAWRQSLYLTGVLSIVLLSFTAEYLIFAGIKSTTFFNKNLLTTLPDYSLISFWLCGAFLSPLYFLFWGHLNFPIWAVIFGSLLLGFCLMVIWLKGTSLERRMAIWALLLNALPFFTVSLGRYWFTFDYAFTSRYVFFTLLGAIILLCTTWTVLKRGISTKFLQRLVAGGVIIMMISGQIVSMPFWQKGYLMLNKAALDYYKAPELFKGDSVDLFNPLHPLGPNQMKAIRNNLEKNNKLYN
jgi:hypothetical protein